MYEAASNPDKGRWMPGGQLNIAAIALSDRDPDAPAMLWAEEDSPSLVHTLSLSQLRRESEEVAASLLIIGMQPGHHSFLSLFGFHLRVSAPGQSKQTSGPQ
jgi:hypothetical protein